MVKHMILWKLREDLSPAEKEQVKLRIKQELEALADMIDGLTEIHVQIHGLPTSTADLMLDSTFTSAEALAAYAVHPAHVAVADSAVRPYTVQRSCLDYETG